MQTAGSKRGFAKRGFAPWTDRNLRPLLRIEGVGKRFGDFVAVDHLSLDIYEGEFFALLGPSGCGKTTLLRLIAGFEQASAGRILLDNVDLGPVPPYQRPVNMMFQSYALFPHLNVEANVGFGLKQEGLAKTEIAERVADMLALVQLEDFRPAQAAGALRRPTPARGAGALPGQAAAGAAARRTDGGARQETARRDAVRADGFATPPRPYLHHRHPRPERGDDGGRPDRGHGPWQAHAGRAAGRHLRGAEFALGRRLHRRGQSVRGSRRRRRHERRGHGVRPAVRGKEDRRRAGRDRLGGGAAGTDADHDASAVARAGTPDRKTAPPPRWSISAISAICRSTSCASADGAPVKAAIANTGRAANATIGWDERFGRAFRPRPRSC